MTKEIYSYPYNARTRDEMKVFLSDQICEQVVKFYSINKDRFNSDNKEIIISFTIIFSILFGMPNESKAVGVSPRFITVPEIHRPAVQTVPQHAPMINPRVDKIRFVKPSELRLWIYIMDEQFIRTSKVNKLIEKLRGGNLIEVTGTLILIIVMWQIMGVGIDGFQIPIIPQNGAVHRPANGGIQQQIDHPKHGGRITLAMSQSNQCATNKAQIDGFINNNQDVDLQKCYAEVNRRASEIGSKDFKCSFERFKSLAMKTEGIVTPNSAQEAITVLQGEMEGYYSHAVRVNYGKGVYGPDFKVIGRGKYRHITHVEIKNPVGSEIEKTSRQGYTDIVLQGNNIGNKLSKQQVKWANETFRKTLVHANPDRTVFPNSPANTLGLVDEYDVPISEKMIMQNAVQNNCTNVSNVRFINNETNI